MNKILVNIIKWRRILGLFRFSGQKESNIPAQKYLVSPYKYFIVDEVAGRRIETEITPTDALQLDKEWFVYDGVIEDGDGVPMIFYRYTGP